jgi:hypothetical protein
MSSFSSSIPAISISALLAGYYPIRRIASAENEKGPPSETIALPRLQKGRTHLLPRCYQLLNLPAQFLMELEHEAPFRNGNPALGSDER